MDSSNETNTLIHLQPQQEYFIGVDSDGCAFDSMEIKHKECFIPNTIKHFGLQRVSRFAREVAEFVNLYSKWRGVNRFPGLVQTLDLLRQRPEVRAREADIPALPATRAWIDRETKLGNPALAAALQDANDAIAGELQRLLAWSEAVNASVVDIVHDVPPIPFVRESLARAAAHADIVVISATPGEALEREWGEHELTRHVAAIAGQEIGTKTVQLRCAAVGKYPQDRVLMIGDAPGDLAAARANGALFYPINPGAESESWQRFLDEAFELFLTGRYAGAYENQCVAAFESLLPETPPWRC